MPYEIQLPDGTIVGDIPDDLDPSAAKAQILKAYPELALGEKRTLGEVATDIVAPIGKGIGSLLQIPGQVAGLVTGRPDETTGLQGVGKRLEAFSEEAKSPVLRAKEALRSQKISQAEGLLDEAGTAIGQTLKDPALLGSFIFEQVPNLIGTMGGGLLTKGVVKALMVNTTEEAMKPALAKAGVRGAVGTGAIMQGADIGTNTFENVYNELISQGVDQDTAMKEALASGRTAAIQAGALTLGTSFGAGATIERALTKGMAGVPKAGIIRGTLGETLSEAVEEGGGQLASNIQLQQVAPETDLLKGVGAAAGLGAIGGALFGLPASFVNKANAAELERAKAQLEEAKRRAAETLQPQNVNLAIGYDPTVEGSGVYTPIIVNPDGTTIFPSERNQFAPTATSELSEEGFREKYGIASPEQIKDRTFDADRIRSFGISPKANLYKNKDVLGADIANPQEAAKVKEALQDYLKKYPKANPTIRKNIEDYLARPEFQPLPVSETPTEITEATTTPEADAQALRDRMIKGFRDRPEIKKIYDEYDKFIQSKDVDKAALSAFNKIVSSEVLKGLGINPVATIYQDPEVLNADLSVPENADRVRAKLMAFKDQSKSQKVKDNIDTYLNRTEFLTPQYIYDILNPPVEVEGKADGQEQFVFIDPDGNIQTKYGNIVQRGKKRFAKYKGGERELTESVLVNPNPDQVEILDLYKRKEQISKEPDEFKQWLMGFGIDPSERADIGIDKRIPNRLFRKGGMFLDDLIRIAIEQNILTAADVDLEGVDGGVSDFRELIRTSIDGGFVPTPKNIRVMMDLESIQNNIEYLENKLKGAPEEAIAEEFVEPGAPKKVEPKEELVSKTVTVDDREIPITMNKTDERSGYSLVDVNVDAFEENFAKDKNFYVGPEGEGGIGKRYAIFTEFAKTAPSIEAPSVGIDENGRVMFDNGRHRYAYFRDKGLKTIPMSMSPESLANAKKFGYVGEKPVTEVTETPAATTISDEIPLYEYNLGINAAMMDSIPNPNLVSKAAIDKLVANNLVKQDPDGTLHLLPKGNALLAEIREFNQFGSKTKSQAEQEALFAKYIPPSEEPQASKATMEGEPKAPKATAEQKKVADQLAKMKNGDVIYQDGDLALIRSYNSAGDAIYFPVKDGTVAMVDIDRFTGKWISDADKQTLKDIKRNLEDVRAKQRNDIVQFDKDGVGLSKDIDPKLAGVISEWKKLFKLNQRIYISTFEDVLANKDKFVGPYTRIVGEASRSRNDNGITAKLANGDRFILFQKSTSVTKMLETIAHEMGHAHQYEVYDNASPEIKKQIDAEYQKWLASQKGKSAKELLNSLRAKKTAETTKAKDGLRAEDLEKFDEYWSSFSEWYADQVARWATTSEKPLSVVDKFFAKIANGLRKIFSMLKNRGYLPNETFKAYMDYITSTDSVKKHPIRPISEADQEPLFSRSTMKASFEGVDEAYAEAVRKQFTQEKATVGQKFESLKDNFFERFITGVFDEFRAIKKYSTEGYMMARLSKSIDGGLQGLLEHGQVYLKDGALDIRANTKGLMEILEPLGTEVDQYQAWKALNRDAQMSADKRSFDEDLVNGRNKLTQGTLNGKPRKAIYEQALKEENELNKSVLDVAFESGLIDRAAYQRFSNDIYYIPFYKEMEDGSVESVNASSKLTGQYFSKALKGGPKKTNDLMENVLLNWSHILSASMKNQATIQTINDAESMGAAERSKPMDGKYPANTIKFMENGKTVHFTLSDPDLVDAISTISYLGPKSAFLDIAKGFTNALRYGVTLSPAYKIRNLIRDSMSSAAVSELGPNMFENVYNGLRMSKKSDPTFMAALAGGGIFEMGTAHEGDQAKLIKRLIDKGIKESTILDTPEKIKGKLQDILDSYNELGNKFENANRLALYKKLRESGKSHLEASFAARDLMDFSMQGQFRTVKVIASVVPFFNARLQGLYKLGRDGITPTYRLIYNATTGKETSASDKQKAQRFMTMSSAIMLASVLLYGIYKDDEDFQRREGWDRDNFWWFKIGDVAFRIPKPFEIGALGTIAERTYEQLADQGVEGKVFAERLNHILMDTFSLNPMPQMIKPLIDIYANKDSFTGAPIESAGMERLSKQERMTNKTSALAVSMGGVSEAAAKVLTFNPDAQGISPIQMDYFIKAYLGWMGATIASTTDLAMEPFTEGTRVRKPVIDTLAMGFIKTEPETQSKYMTQFYENNAKLQSALADMRHYAELGDMEKVTKIMEEKGDKIALSKVYDKATKQLAELRKQSRIIENSKDISTEDKRAEMNRIKILMSDLARQMEEIRKSK